MAVTQWAAASTRPVLRTCVGCRRRVPVTELFRVVVEPSGAEGNPRVVPDLRRGLPGRGAWLHRSQDCLATAQRRRAFGRALRVSAELDLTAVALLLNAVDGSAAT